MLCYEKYLSLSVEYKSLVFDIFLQKKIKMAEKIRRQALSIQENELLSVEVRKYPCLYDKSKKEYRDKIVVANAWKEVADQLPFTNNG